MIEQLISLGVSIVTGIAGVIRASGLSDEAAEKHLEELYARLAATRADVHVEAEKTRALAEKLP